LGELRNRPGGNSGEARFEERVRILKEIVTAVAEVERFVAGKGGEAEEIESVLRRFSSLLPGQNVTPLEAIGTEVAFNPQRQRLVETSDLQPGQPVRIVERGYLIRDHTEKLRLLKPAIVKKM
jgi:molecular chaperone GrpE (heat shock protein)